MRVRRPYHFCFECFMNHLTSKSSPVYKAEESSFCHNPKAWIVWNDWQEAHWEHFVGQADSRSFSLPTPSGLPAIKYLRGYPLLNGFSISLSLSRRAELLAISICISIRYKQDKPAQPRRWEPNISRTLWVPSLPIWGVPLVPKFLKNILHSSYFSGLSLLCFGMWLVN